VKNADFQLKGCKPVRHHDKRRGGYHGSFKRVCDRSGFVYDAEDTRKEWTGLIVGKDQWEPRHPQEFVRGLPTDITVPDPRPGSPFSAGAGVDINDLTAVSGSVAASVYTSGATDETRPFVYWTLDLGAEVGVNSATLSSFAAAGATNPDIRKGFYIETSSDNITYTPLLEAINEQGGGVSPAATDYVVQISKDARYLRLTLRGGKGLGYTGVITMTGLSVSKES